MAIFHGNTALWKKIACTIIRDFSSINTSICAACAMQKSSFSGGRRARGHPNGKPDRTRLWTISMKSELAYCGSSVNSYLRWHQDRKSVWNYVWRCPLPRSYKKLGIPKKLKQGHYVLYWLWTKGNQNRLALKKKALSINKAIDFTVMDLLIYYTIVKEVLGDKWLTNKWIYV